MFRLTFVSRGRERTKLRSRLLTFNEVSCSKVKWSAFSRRSIDESEIRSLSRERLSCVGGFEARGDWGMLVENGIAVFALNLSAIKCAEHHVDSPA